MRSLVPILMLLSSDAFALTCTVPSLEEQFRHATHVVLVEMADARIEQSDSHPAMPRQAPTASDVALATVREPAVRWRRIAATVNVIDVYKGENPPTRLLLTNWGYSPQITVGATYLVFLDDPNVSLDCGEIRMISSNDPEQARVLEQLRVLAK